MLIFRNALKYGELKADTAGCGFFCIQYYSLVRVLVGKHNSGARAVCHGGAGDVAHVVFSPQKGGNSLCEKGGFTG